MNARTLILALTAGIAGLAVTAAPANWAAFRGPNSAGVSPNTHPPVKISPTNGVLWSAEIPWSPSSPCVWGDRIFLTTFNDGKLETRGYSTRDGRLLWSKVAPVTKLEEYHMTEGSPAAATPITDGKVVVSYFGSFGLKAVEPMRVTARQIEAARRALTRHMKRSGRVWVTIFPDVPVSSKPAEVRMGSGKGQPEFWVCRVKPGRIMFEIDGVSRATAEEGFALAQAKLPIRTKVVARLGMEG